MIELHDVLLVAVSIVGVVLLLLIAFLLLKYGSLWLQSYSSGADIGLIPLVAMSLRGVKPATIVTAKVMGSQAGLDIDTMGGLSTSLLEAHQLSGGNAMAVLQAIIAAHRAGIDLNFDRAAAIDLAGRNVLDAVRTSISPMVINCPDSARSGKSTITAIAKDGVELKIKARVTVRTNMDQLIGGATEETIIARVGQGIISAIGSATTHMDVLEMPDQISREVLASALDANTAFEIVSIDIADITVGDNIGARLQSDQAEADVRVARAQAESRRADAVALEQENKAQVTQCRAELILAECRIPKALADAFRAGQLSADRKTDGEGNLRVVG